MRQFNEGEHAREERQKYQKTAQTLTLFIISYIGQWWAWITFCVWSFFGDPSMYLVSTAKTDPNEQACLCWSKDEEKMQTTLTFRSFHTLHLSTRMLSVMYVGV